MKEEERKVICSQLPVVAVYSHIVGFIGVSIQFVVICKTNDFSYRPIFSLILKKANH